MTAKIHRILLHVKDHRLLHGFIRRGSTEEHEYEKNKFKKGSNFTKKHLETIASQLLRAHFHSDKVFHTETESGSDGDAMDDCFDTNFDYLMSLMSKVIETVGL